MLTLDNLVLASSSPRRKELLSMITPNFTVCPSHTSEKVPTGTPATAVAAYLACLKAVDVGARYPTSVVVGCDTVVRIDGHVLGKPANPAASLLMLKRLSGRTHEVDTGVCIRRGKQQLQFTERTQVTFFPLTEKEIREYLMTGEPFDKAGSYGIQGKGALFIKCIEGDFYNVVGLPIARLYRALTVFASGGTAEQSDI